MMALASPRALGSVWKRCTVLPRRTTLTPFLYPTIQPSCRRHASILSSLSDNPGAYNKRIRRGRGPSSGKGKTSGRGHKGQGQHGKVPAGFNGGQTPDEVVHGVRGFTPISVPDLVTVPISKIQSWIAQGRLSASHPITPRELWQSGCVRPLRSGIKLLAASRSHSNSLDAQPPLSMPLNLVVSRASASAIAAIEKAGGTVTTRYYTKWSLQQIVNGKMDPVISLKWNGPIPQYRGSKLVTGATRDALLEAAKRSGTLIATTQSSPSAIASETNTEAKSAKSTSGKPTNTTDSLPSETPAHLPHTQPPASPLTPTHSRPARAIVTASDTEPISVANTDYVQSRVQTTGTAALLARRRFPYRLPDPTRRVDLEYYRDPAHRGYLAWEIQPGQGPSLFWLPPPVTEQDKAAAQQRRAKKRRTKTLAEGRIW